MHTISMTSRHVASLFALACAVTALPAASAPVINGDIFSTRVVSTGRTIDVLLTVTPDRTPVSFFIELDFDTVLTAPQVAAKGGGVFGLRYDIGIDVYGIDWSNNTPWSADSSPVSFDIPQGSSRYFSTAYGPDDVSVPVPPVTVEVIYDPAIHDCTVISGPCFNMELLVDLLVETWVARPTIPVTNDFAYDEYLEFQVSVQQAPIASTTPVPLPAGSTLAIGALGLLALLRRRSQRTR